MRQTEAVKELVKSFREWLDAELWDRKIAAGAKNGKFDALAERAT